MLGLALPPPAIAFADVAAGAGPADATAIAPPNVSLPEPQEVSVSGDTIAGAYFGMTMKLPPWTKGVKVPVHLIIGPDGAVRHVHVIRPPDEWAGPAIASTMQKWRFKPYLVDGKPIEIATGFDIQADGIPE